MSQEKDIKIAQLTQENKHLSEQIDEMKKALISADNALGEQVTFLTELKTELISVKSELNIAEKKLRRLDKILNETWYGKLINLVYRILKKIKRILLRK